MTVRQDPPLGTGALQVTLRWDTTVDMDLHVIEPNGTHVFYNAPNGTTARLDVDDRDGFGPENIFVSAGQAAAGVYQIYLVQYSEGDVATRATISVTLDSGTPAAQTFTFSRTTTTGNPAAGFNVANVNVLTRQVVETTGTRVADERGVPPQKSKANP